MTSLATLPDEILLAIFAMCDVKSLLNVSLTCSRFYLCIDTECFWKQKLQDLYGDYELPTKVKPRSGYKSACLRYCAVFGNVPLQAWTDCSRCQSPFCAISCIQERDEVIIFDFGSKTTWFKYASDSTGQLSMHPTVAPVKDGNTNPLSHSADDSRDIYQCCPVCSRMYNSKLTSLAEAKTVVLPKVVRSHHGSRRLTSAFSKLASRHFPSCFDSSDLIEDEVLSLTDDLKVTSFSPPCSEDKAESDTAEITAELQGAEAARAVDTVLDDIGQNTTADHSQNVDPTEAVAENSAESYVMNEAGKSDMYKFLIMHMLKRNPCFQAKCIPFVLCEPTHCCENMKIQLMQFLFTELKVPGVCYIPKPVATALYSGIDTCIVIDSGANNTVVSAVVDQNMLGHCVSKKEIGGMFLTRRLLDCIKMKGVEFEVDEANIDSSQVKRECHLAYNIETENRKVNRPKNIHVKGFSEGHMEYQPVTMGPELYLASEDMYLNMDLPAMVADTIHALDGATCKKLLSNIVLTGGNCRLNGLALRLGKDLQKLLPEHAASIRVVDPRLMTGRTDAVIGASYIRKWYDAIWVTRQDYVYHGASGCMERAMAKQVHCV